jgi:hypothetical protein
MSVFPIASFLLALGVPPRLARAPVRPDSGGGLSSQRIKSPMKATGSGWFGHNRWIFSAMTYSFRSTAAQIRAFSTELR